MTAIIAKLALVLACAIGLVILAHASRKTKPIATIDYEQVDTIVGDGAWHVPQSDSALIRHMLDETKVI